MEPGAILAKEIISPIIKWSLERATKLLDRAEQANKNDVAAILQCLEGARVAVWGLGQEREAILSDAATCNLDDAKQVHMLVQRLDQYLRRNNLRPLLERAIVRLHLVREMAAERNEPALYWPFRNKDRDAALDAVKQQLDALIDFLNRLGDRLRHLQPSGIGVPQLLLVEHALKVGSKTQLRSAVDAARGQESREWLDRTLQMETVIADLDDAFR